MRVNKPVVAAPVIVALGVAVSLLSHKLLAEPNDQNAYLNSEKSILEQSAKQRIGSFAKELGGTLKAALADGGFPHGVSMCKEKAPGIAAGLSTDGWHVGRTSLKIRNSSNAPDSWEKSILEAFEQQKADGAAFSSLVHSEIVEQDGKRTYRYMQAIRAGEFCLSCHGANVDPSLVEKIKSEYPSDQATGFAAGDIRGAFTVTKSL